MRLVCSCVLVSVTAVCAGQMPVLVRDLDTTPVAAVAPELSTALPLQSASVFAVGSGLWRSDGSTGVAGGGTALLTDLATGATQPTGVGALPHVPLVRLGGVGVFFASNRGTFPRRLWRTDGTAEGTFPIASFPLALDSFGSAAVSGSHIPQVVPAGPVAFFVVNPQNNARWELWRTDGTAAGTQRVRTSPGPLGQGGGATISIYAAASSVALARVSTGAISARLEMIDAEGNVATVLNESGVAMSGLQDTGTGAIALACGERFVVGVPIAGPGFPLHRINPVTLRIEPIGASITGTFAGWIAAGSAAYVLASDRGVYFVDAEAAEVIRVGTAAFADPLVRPETAWAASGERLLFHGREGSNPAELFVTMGGGAAPGAVRFPGDLRVPFARALAPLGTGFFGGFGDTARGAEPSFTPGVSAGTIMLADVDPSQAGGGPEGRSGFCAGTRPVVTDDGVALFLASPDQGPCRLWRTDATPSGTIDLGLIPGPINASSSPRGLALPAGGLVVRLANQLVRADDGAVISPASNQTEAMLEVGGRLVFSAGSSGALAGAWATDGTAAGTERIVPTTGVLRSAGVVDGRGVMVVGNGRLYATDGTVAGTRVLLNIEPSALRDVSVVADAGLAFVPVSASDQISGLVIVTDGTPAGTRTMEESEAPDPRSDASAFVRAGEWIVFVRRSIDQPVSSLWRCSLTGTQAERLRNLPPADIAPSIIGVSTGARALFVIAEVDRPITLVSTDGTPGGTSVFDVPAIGSSAGGVVIPAAAALGGRVLFQAATPDHGAELWASDGTPGGTGLLKDISPGRHDGFPSEFVVDGAHAYFAAESLDHGRELWRTDGTEAGTVRVTDLAPGRASAAPSRLTIIGRTLYFSAADQTRGVEPWSLSLCPADFNGDGALDPDDLGDFINCYFDPGPCALADFNGDGSVDADDLGDFINAYFAGCP